MTNSKGIAHYGSGCSMSRSRRASVGSSRLDRGTGRWTAPGAEPARTSSLMTIMRSTPTAWPRTTFCQAGTSGFAKCWRWSPTARTPIGAGYGRRQQGRSTGRTSRSVPTEGGILVRKLESAWSQQVAARFGTPGDVRNNYPDAVATLRTALRRWRTGASLTSRPAFSPISPRSCGPSRTNFRR